MLVQRTARLARPRRVRRLNRVAFTLLEVLLVLAILVVLASLAVGVFSGSQNKANKDAAQHEVTEFSNEANLYKLHTGAWPNQLEDLKDNVSNVPNWNGPYTKKNNFLDPWGQPYEIVGPDQYDSTLIIKSLGKPGDNQEIVSSGG